MRVRDALHPITTKDGKILLAAFCYTTCTFCKLLHGLKVPDRYSSNNSLCIHVQLDKLSQLKFHNCHILVHQLLPSALRRSIPMKIVFQMLLSFIFSVESYVPKDYLIEGFHNLRKKIAVVSSSKSSFSVPF